MKIFLLLISTMSVFCGYSQSTARNSAWYVELKDSTILYSKKLSVINSLSEGEYLLLDNNKKIPMSQVIRYRSRGGEFIRDKGPVETYRLEKGGPRLFVYSRSYYYSDSTGYQEGRNYFFRKGSTGDMQKMNYKNLKDALADNPASLYQLQAARSKVIAAGVTAAASFLITVIGIQASFRENTGRRNANPAAKGYTSPMLVAGPVIMVASITVMFTAPGHVRKAINIYNQ
ncbi:MAG TPA: hypothetical protein VF008_31205 [Niastella sp.]